MPSKESVAEISHFSPQPTASLTNSGKVSLVGAGPGDPDLLTIKALRTIQCADIILFDRLVSQEICQLFPPSTPTIYIGKAKNHHSIPQSQINELLLTKAKQGLHICRLKGGDSFVFGRGGEEMLPLKQANIEVEVVPGITAASGCSSYAGIPLTHRGLSQGCTFLTAHAEKNLDVNWHSLARLKHTLVVYMGLTKAAFISENLIASGLCTHTPAALVENGCTNKQRVITGTLEQLPHLVQAEQVKSPALIIIGHVVDLSQQLHWFQTINKQELKRLSA